jgi:hypothetical protein
VAEPERKDEEQRVGFPNPEFGRFEDATESLLRISRLAVDMSRAQRARQNGEREKREHRRAGWNCY